MTTNLRSTGCVAVLFALVSYAGASAAETADAARPGADRQIWQVLDGTATFNFNRGVALEPVTGRRSRPSKPADTTAASEVPIRAGSQLVISLADGRLAVVGGTIALANGIELSSAGAVRSLSDVVVRPVGDADIGTFRITDASGGGDDGMLISPAQVRVDRSERTVVISSDDVTLTAGLAELLGRPELAREPAGGVTIRARIQPIAPADSLFLDPEPTLVAAGGVAGVIGPDVTVWDVGALATYGVVFDSVRDAYISAFAIATRSCNEGDEPAIWIEETNEHPVIAQHMYRLRNNRFEQIGMSWVKHAFFATRENVCGTCVDPCPSPSVCETGTRLGVGCSDLYQATLNGGQHNLGPRSPINAFNGEFPYPFSAPPIGSLASRRLQIRNTDLDVVANAGAMYYAEGQYVTTDEPAFDNQHNNVSHKRALILPEDGQFCKPCGQNPCADPGFCINVSGSTFRYQPAIRAWKRNDDTVVETDLRVPDTTLGQEGFMVLAAKAYEIGSGVWRYEYALQNLTSDRSVGSFSVPLPTGAALTNIGFHDVEYHSGDPYDGADWPYEIADNAITWATTPYSENVNANALRWGTLYNFRFDANVEPEDSTEDPRPVTVTLGLFKPGDPSEAEVKTIGPSTGFIDCQPNGITDRCDVACSKECPEPCGGSDDCNTNLVPDECEPDCNTNDTPDECDILFGGSGDCDGNGVPDECDPDCDDDGTIDACETVYDTDGDCIPDCDDLCPATTPAGECCCEECCCFETGFCGCGLWTADQCLSFVPPGTPTCIDEPCRLGCLIGDGDGDADHDLRDADSIMRCYSSDSGSTAFLTPTAECRRVFDFDDDGDIDLDDAARFLDIFLGPNDPSQ
jgi:hypothetical protein